MKRFHFPIVVAIMVLAFFSLSAFRPSSTAKTNNRISKHPTSFAGKASIHLLENYGRLPLAFEPNQGQTDPQVQYLARGSGYTLFITPQEAVLELKKNGKDPHAQLPGKWRKPHQLNSGISGDPKPTVLHMKLEGVRADGVFENMEKLPGVSNYFIGKDPSEWRRSIPQYGKVQARDLYPGIDLVYYGNQGKLEYDFIVKPGADPGVIHLSYEGVKSSRVNGQGDLELETEQGILHFRSPSVYQNNQGQMDQVVGKYRMEENGKIGFEIKDYDRTKPLVIDPVLDYSSYWGGSNSDQGAAIALDNAGNAYFTGFTESVDFPMVNPGQGILNGAQNAYVTEINSSGTAMIYSTYLGGTGTDAGTGIVVDSSGNAFITGSTNSTDFPTTG